MAKKKNKYEGFRRLTLLLSWVSFVIGLIVMANSNIQADEVLFLIGLMALFFYGVYKGVTYTLKGFFD